ncbi:MAG: hypothetical protein H6865_05295 [Rhodospirillales bacterium]|nr:hypothetical protein [Alphaproteobacteria bacterium]MCB9987034.1 hypothetical protein [Rhodospirillales bacterium]USO08197.1 MAG: hypothetical protein H6866_02995 [Rhodospirillales bacterium]
MSETNLLEQASEVDAAPAQGTSAPDISARPQGLPDKFWDEGTGQVRLDDLIKSYCALEKRLSTGFQMPEDPEGRMRVLRAMGVPETADGYVIDLKTDLLRPDTQVNERLHAKGFTPEQVQEVYDLAAERLVPMVLDVAAEFQADREIERLVADFGGPEQWREVSRQLLAYGRKSLPPAVLEGLSASYDGVMALYRMMKGDAPGVMDKAQSGAPASESDLHALMRDPKYWRDRDPTTIARVTEGFKQLYGAN